MNIFRKYLNFCFVLYVIGGLILYKSINHRMVNYQLLDNYQWSAQALIKCSKTVCDDVTLKSGIHYYFHLSNITKGTADEFNALGFCFYSLKEYRRALYYFTQSLHLNTNNPGLYFNQAMVFLQMKDYVNAKKSLRMGLNIMNPMTFFTSNLVSNYDVNPSDKLEDKLRLQFMNAVDQFNGLLTMLDQIDGAGDLVTKKERDNELHRKLESIKLYYYIPVYSIKKDGKNLTLL